MRVTFPHSTKAPMHTFLGTKLTLPLTEESVGHNSHHAPEANMLALRHGLGENICHLVISRHICQSNCTSLNPVSDKMVPDLDMLRPVVKYRILREFDTTLIITIDRSRPQLLTKQSDQQLAKPNGLTTGLTSLHVLRLC